MYYNYILKAFLACQTLRLQQRPVFLETVSLISGIYPDIPTGIYTKVYSDIPTPGEGGGFSTFPARLAVSKNHLGEQEEKQKNKQENTKKILKYL